MANGRKSYDCAYIDKSTIDLKSLIGKFNSLNINEIADELGINHQTVYGYTSTSERYAKVKVPQVFIDKLFEKIEERQKATDTINEKIKAIN